jgi:predicted transcriptional regulator
MNIHTVAENLRNTIAGKEQHLKTLNSDLVAGDYVDRTVTKTTIEFLKLNIDELRRILQDVEVCCQQHTEMGWQINPERMGQ